MSTDLLAPPPPPAKLVTAEEFTLLSHKYAELVRGVLVELPMPSLRHGQVCLRIGRFIANYVDEQQLGHAMGNDSHFLIDRDPDTVRGPDVSFYSYERLPPGPAPTELTSTAPDLAVEVRSPSNTWVQIFGKVLDYLRVGVRVVVVIDPEGMTASVYRPNLEQAVLYTGDTLTIPDVLPGFSVPVAKLFE